VLRTRVWTSLVALPAVLAIVALTPDLIFTGIVAGLALFGLYEIGLMTGARRPIRIAAIVAAGAVPIALVSWQGRGSRPAAIAVVAAMLALVAIIAVSGVTASDSDREGERTPLTLLGALYVGVLFPYFALLRNRPGGINLLILVLLLVIASDTGAYFTGRSIGRHKLAPNVSPNKTVEGAFGGVAFTLVIGWLLGPMLVPQWPMSTLTVASLGIGVAAEAGDLANSAFKRVAGVKDSGWIFPGHGGLLDRASSLVFAVAFTYYYTQ
jgi:phosphatidate cytidylyltransferase